MASNSSFSSPSSSSTLHPTDTFPQITCVPSLLNAGNFLSIKLTNKNYISWKTQLIPYLKGQNLLSFIDGSNPCPCTFYDICQSHHDFESFITWTHHWSHGLKILELFLNPHLPLLPISLYLKSICNLKASNRVISISHNYIM